MPIPQFHRAIHQGRALEVVPRLQGWQQHAIEARCHEIRAAGEDPKLRAFLHFDGDFCGCQRRPAYNLFAVPPIDPSRAPLVARDPDPTVIRVEVPPSVVIGDPSPIRLLDVLDPIPSVGFGIDPVADGVRAPIQAATGGHPDFTESPVVMPRAIGREGTTKVRRHGNALLRRSRTNPIPPARHRHKNGTQGKASHHSRSRCGHA